jgi:hypothetical protein
MMKESRDEQQRRYHRERALAFASGLTVYRENPEDVTKNARPLLAWLEAGVDFEDRRARFEALNRADMNRSCTRARDNAPEKLIAEAEVFYAFLKVA